MVEKLVSSALEEYMLLLQFGPAVLASVAALSVRLDDLDMKIVWESKLLSDMFGYEPLELRGQPIDALLLPENRPLHRQHFARYRESPTIRTMNAGVWVDAVKKDGAKFKVQVSLYPTSVGKTEMIIAHVVDVTKAWLHLSPSRPLAEGH